MDWSDRSPPLLIGMDMRPIDGMKTEFGSWTDEALNGYVIMLEAFVSSSVSDAMTQRYQEKLDTARTEVANRLAKQGGEPTVEFHGEVVMREELGSTYDHERTEHPDPDESEDGD